MKNPAALTRPPRRTKRGAEVSTPLYSLGTAAVMFAGAVFLVATDKASGQGAGLVAIVLSTLPSLVAAGFAERVSRDVRNGTVVEKAREGTVKALEDTGVTAAVKDGQDTTPAALNTLAMQTQALTHLLDRMGVPKDPTP